jgi:hypothetical protein
LLVAFGFSLTPSKADTNNGAALPSFSSLQTASTTATATETSGLNSQIWATIVDCDGNVSAVAFSGTNRGA